MAIYAGTFLTDANIKPILDLAMGHTQIAALGQAPEAVELTRRKSEPQPGGSGVSLPARSLLFVLNHYPTARTARVSAGAELISGTFCDGNLELPPYGVAVIEEIAD